LSAIDLGVELEVVPNTRKERLATSESMFLNYFLDALLTLELSIMDGRNTFNVTSIAVSFPLPFHIFVLVGLAILGWATNLHGLDIAGIDVVGAMDLRTDGGNPLPAHHPTAKHNSNLAVHYCALYRICMVYCLLGFVSWAVYRRATHGDLVLMDTFGYIPGITALLALGILLCPYNVLHKTERRKFLQSVFLDCELTVTHPCLREVLLADVCCLLHTALSISAT
jgi:EXS family